MLKTEPVSTPILEFLRHTDTCTVSNAIETLDVRMRNEGYVHGSVRSIFPDLPPIAGYAVTGSIRSAAPPISGLCYYQRADWWQYVASVPGPKIMVIQDLDHIPGTGALVGEIHAEIGRALGCVGYLTNGVARDLDALEAMRFPCFASGAGVSHSYAHIVEFGAPVHIGGLTIAPGDLLHGDRNGIHCVPLSVTEQLPGIVEEIRAHESELISLCRSRDFSADKLEAALRNACEWSPRPECR
jgi:4-hydroxy-4-methyl-2-oxoglutarate aldolase